MTPLVLTNIPNKKNNIIKTPRYYEIKVFFIFIKELH
jgi:hypothetical protein